MKIKKILLIVLLSLVFILIIVKAQKIKRYFAEQRYYSICVMLNMAERCYNPYKDDAEIFIQEGFNYEQNNKQVIHDSLHKIMDQSIVNNDLKIPNITHQIYFTPKESTQIIKDFYIAKLKANFSKLNAVDSNWQHLIWTNNPTIFPNEIKQFKGVVIKDIHEFKGHPLYPTLINTINKGTDLAAYFAESADLLRLLALQKFGGIYNDMDYEIYDAARLYELMKRFDFIGGREKVNYYSYYGNSFIVAKPNHPVINEAIERMIRNYRQDMEDKNTPNYIKYPCTENDRLYFNGPPLITISYFAKNNIDGNNDIILPFWMVLNQYFAHYKNKSCNYSQITKERFNINNANLDHLIEEFNNSFSIDEFSKYYRIINSNGADPNEQNIYYDTKYRKDFPIIGADMGCGTWVTATNPRHFYWK